MPATDSEIFFGRRGPLWLEIGAGKGGFACRMTEKYPEALYLAMERVSDCVVIGAESAKATADARPDNLRFVIDNADHLSEWFAPASVDCIFLNFSDPWSKKGYRKRRLTYRAYLASYFTILKDGGVLRFKTDNEGLFDFSLEEIEALGLVPRIVTRDLHASEYAADNVMTEYETNFVAQGMKIHMLEIEKPAGFVPHYMEEKRREEPDGESTDL